MEYRDSGSADQTEFTSQADVEMMDEENGDDE